MSRERQENMLNTLLQVAEHIGFMEANSTKTDEYKILSLRDELEEIKSRYQDMLAADSHCPNCSMNGESDE